jgi:hypothetical protein
VFAVALAPLAEVGCDFRWTWRQEGEPAFRRIDACRSRPWRQNPVRLRQVAPEESPERAGDHAIAGGARRGAGPDAPGGT